MKRKVKRDGALTNNNTPTESMVHEEFAFEQTEEENIKGANRNSKKGRQGKGKEVEIYE